VDYSQLALHVVPHPGGFGWQDAAIAVAHTLLFMYALRRATSLSTLPNPACLGF